MERKKISRFMLLQIFLAITVLFISIYSLVTENFSLQPLSFIVMSAMFFIIGLREYKRTKSFLWGIF